MVLYSKSSQSFSCQEIPRLHNRDPLYCVRSCLLLYMVYKRIHSNFAPWSLLTKVFMLQHLICHSLSSQGSVYMSCNLRAFSHWKVCSKVRTKVCVFDTLYTFALVSFGFILQLCKWKKLTWLTCVLLSSPAWPDFHTLELTGTWW